MKNLSVYALLAISTITTSCAQEKKVPENIVKAFEKEHPNTKVSWDFEKEGYEAEFEINEKDASESYDFNGKKIASEIEIEKRELPQNILQYLSKNYPKNKIKETAKITDSNKVITYEVELKIDGKKQDLLFSSTGNFIKILDVE